MGKPARILAQNEETHRAGKEEIICDPNGSIGWAKNGHKKELIEKWRNDFTTLLNANSSIPHTCTVVLQKAKRSVKLRCLLNSVSSYPQKWVKEAGKLLWVERDALLHQKNKIAAGTNGLPAEVLKNDVCISFLQNLFHRVWKACVFPQLHFGDMERLFPFQRVKQMILEFL